LGWRYPGEVQWEWRGAAGEEGRVRRREGDRAEGQAEPQVRKENRRGRVEGGKERGREEEGRGKRGRGNREEKREEGKEK
jgi:hypothetical protein